MPDIFISEGKDKSQELQTNEDLVKPSNKKVDYLQGFGKAVGGALSSYFYLPEKVNFEDQNPDEKVILVLRQHPIVNVRWIIIGFLMLIAPIALSSFPLLASLPSRFQFISILIWYLVTMAFIIENFFYWYFNVDLITTERVVDVDLENLIYKQVSDANLDKIQDVSYKMGGAIRTLFNYGDVVIQTASEVPNFDFLAVPNPDKVTKLLQDLREQEEEVDKEKL